MTTPAIIYAAKSTEDKHGSIPDQLADCRAMAEREGWIVLDEFTDEGFSAYKRSRGPGLADARRVASEAATEAQACVLVVQHSDRLARGAGDAPGAAEHLAEILFWARRHRVELRSVQDDLTFTGPMAVMLATMMGERNYEDSRRKSESVKSGKDRRFKRGKPGGGPTNDGYQLVTSVLPNGAVQSEREPHPERAPLIRSMFDAIEAGHTCGDVARDLNSQGMKTQRGKSWSRRGVRLIVTNPFYAGLIVHNGETCDGDHMPLIDRDRWQAIQDSLKRRDPATVAYEKGGRPPADDYLLRQVAFCGRCGQSLRTRRLSSGRVYVCRHVREAMGLCDAPKIPADVIEGEVLRHLDDFFLDIDAWIAERVADMSSERKNVEQALAIEKRALSRLERECEAIEKQYRDLLRTDGDLAATALRQLGKAEAEKDAQASKVAEVDARLATWEDTPNVDVALDYWNELQEAVRGRIRAAKGVRDMNAALRSILQGVWIDTEDDGRIVAEFALRETLAVTSEKLPAVVQTTVWPDRVRAHNRLSDRCADLRERGIDVYPTGEHPRRQANTTSWRSDPLSVGLQPGPSIPPLRIAA